MGAPIAAADEINRYLGEVIVENDLGRHIHYRHRVTAASWSGDTATWTVEVADMETGATRTVTTGFLWMCQGYYRHEQGYTPEWLGMDEFQGRIVYPQTDTLRELEIDETWIHEITRRKILKDQDLFARMAVEHPDFVRKELIKGVAELLPDGYDVDTHFTPTYRPWRQRLAFVPDGDLFAGIRDGRASVVTDEIETFTPTGVRTRSGQDLEADVIVTATGFDLSVLGDIPFTIDGDPLDLSTTVTYRGMMFTGVPNLVWIFGYFRASWTLRVDLVADFVCRLLAHMDARTARQVMPQLRPGDADMVLGPWVDPDDFNPGYLQRSVRRMPRCGDKPEWRHTQDYWNEKNQIPAADLDDGCLRYD